MHMNLQTHLERILKVAFRSFYSCSALLPRAVKVGDQEWAKYLYKLETELGSVWNSGTFFRVQAAKPFHFRVLQPACNYGVPPPRGSQRWQSIVMLPDLFEHDGLYTGHIWLWVPNSSLSLQLSLAGSLPAAMVGAADQHAGRGPQLLPGGAHCRSVESLENCLRDVH